MDWNSIKEKAVKLKDSAVSKSKPLLDKAVDKSKPYLEKVGEWGYENVQKIPMVMKTGEDFDKVRIEKNLVIFVLTKDEEFSKKVMTEFPLILSRAWIVSATTRIIQKEESPELLVLLDNPACPSVLIYKKGILFRKIETREELDLFVKDFNISDLPVQSPSDTPEADPLSTL